jgi:glycosyltransferase involved in cell wall biosynthesis
VGVTLAAMGGGERVGATLIEALNDVGICPDVYSIAPVPKEYFGSFYGKNLRYRLIPAFPFRIKVLGIYQRILSSSLGFRLTGYDVVVNTTGVYMPMLFGRHLKRYILYVYNPITMLKEQKYAKYGAKLLSISKYEKSLFWKMYFAPYKTIIGYSLRNINLGTELLAVSQFTKWRLKKYAGMQSKVVYPPVDIKTFSTVLDNADRDGVISIGRFTPEKEQLKQLKIAKRLPDITFRLCGSAKTPYYWHWYQHVKAKAEEKGLKNVKFYPNIPFRNLVSLIGNSKIFIHTMRYEDFGLTTCEAIAGGCIPCVVDSGGQRESVPFRNLRFRNVEEAVSAIQRINNTNNVDLLELRKKLFEHIKQFDEKNFKEQMLKVIFGDNA